MAKNTIIGTGLQGNRQGYERLQGNCEQEQCTNRYRQKGNGLDRGGTLYPGYKINSLLD